MKLVIITGGSKGLGLALCQSFKSLGYEVIDISKSAPHAYSYKQDLSWPIYRENGAIKAASSKTLEEVIYINNAAQILPVGRKHIDAYSGPLFNHDPIMRNLNINFVTPILLIEEFMHWFENQNCRKLIVNITSGAEKNGYPGLSFYCAAKAGMANYIKALIKDQTSKAYPFTLMNFNPGVIDTDMQKQLRETKSELQKDFIKLKEEGKLLSPEAVAQDLIKTICASLAVA